MNTQRAIDYTARRKELEQKKEQLSVQIFNCTDAITTSLLRADYRAVIDELETFYDDDIQEGPILYDDDDDE